MDTAGRVFYGVLAGGGTIVLILIELVIFIASPSMALVANVIFAIGLLVGFGVYRHLGRPRHSQRPDCG